MTLMLHAIIMTYVKDFDNFWLLYFSTSPNWCFILPGETESQKLPFFYLNSVCYFVNRHKTH